MSTSSQSFAPMSRLLWKEYRVQRSFWLAMVVLGILPQVMIRMMIRPDDGMVMAVWSIVAVAPILFVFGSTAILFAGEREERTNDWLINVAVSPIWVLMAKWCLVLVASLTMVLALSISAVMLVWQLPASTQNYILEEEIPHLLWFFAGFLVWGSLGSLLSRRVVTAVPSMGFWWMMTMIVPMAWIPWIFGVRSFDPVHRRLQDIVMTLSFLVVGIADVWLGWRWCRGRFLDASVLDDLHVKAHGWLARLRGMSTAVSRMPTRPEFANSWRREWQRLIWQERYRESYHGMLLAVSFVVIGLLMYFSTNQTPMMSGILPLIMPFPMGMGILGFRYEGKGAPFHFLTNRGVSPRVVWAAKHVIWMPRAVWIPLVVWIIALFAEWLKLSPGRGGEIARPLSDPEFWPLIALFVLLSYGAGHLAAMNFRRVILAFVVATFLCVVLSTWLALMYSLNVPLWWSVGGIAVWLYVLSWQLAPHWLTEGRPLDRPGRLAGAVLLPPLVLCGLVGFWRASEIRGFGSQGWAQLLHPHDFVQQNLLNPSDPGRAMQWQSWQQEVIALKQEEARQTAPVDADEQKIVDTLAAATGGLDTVAQFYETENDSHLSEAEKKEREQIARAKFWSANRARLDSILSVTQGDRKANVVRWRPLGTGVMLPQQKLLMEAGRLRTEEGKLGEALDYYCACLRLATYWASAGNSVLNDTADRQQRITMASIVEWANHTAQSSSSLQSAIQRVRRELAMFPGQREKLVADFLRERELLDEFIKEGMIQSSRLNERPKLAEISRYLPWERYRAKRHLEQQLIDADSSMQLLFRLINHPGVDGNRHLNEIERVALLGNPPTLTPLNTSRLTLFAQSYRSLYLQRETFVRESILALVLVNWKLEHGHWPAALADLLEPTDEAHAIPVATVIDPWTGEFFHYDGARANLLTKTESIELLSSLGSQQTRRVPVSKLAESDYGSTAYGTKPELRTWNGLKKDANSDDRARLEISGGALKLKIPSLYLSGG